MAKIKFRAKEGGGDFTLVPKGTYDFQIVELDAEVTSRKGEPQVKVVFEIAEGDYQGEKVPSWFTFDEEDKQGWKMRNLLDATGVDYEELDSEEVNGKTVKVLEFDPEDLISRYVQSDLTHYEKDKKTYHQLDATTFKASRFQAAADGGAPSTGGQTSAEQAAQPSTSAPAADNAPRRRPRAGA